MNTHCDQANDKASVNDGSSNNGNRRDGPLAQKLTVEINRNANISSAGVHSHYKLSPNNSIQYQEQEQVSPSDGVWGFLPSPSNDEQSSEPEKQTSESVSLVQKSNPCSSMEIKTETHKPMNDNPNGLVTQENDEDFDRPRIVIQKIRFDDPTHCPADLDPKLIEEFLHEKHSPKPNGEQSTRPRRSRNIRETTMNLKRDRTGSSDEDYDDDENSDDNFEDSRPVIKKRIRTLRPMNENVPRHDPIGALNKKTRDRLAQKALEIDADPQSNTSYQRFIELLDAFHEDYTRHQQDWQDENIDKHYLDVLLPEQTLEEMANLSEKLKLSTYMCHIDRSQLKHLLEILSLRIKQGVELNPILRHDDDQDEQTEEDERAWRNLIFERLIMCANACEVALNIMTTANMPREILLENVIEHTALFIKAQLSKTIFPEYDPVYRSDNQSKDPIVAKQKRSKVTGSKCKQVQLLYNRLVSLFQGITDLMRLGKFTDTIILAVSSFSVSCFYVENIFDLQAHSLNILGELFSRYDHHRDSILDDLLLSLVRLPTSKKSLRCYRLASGEYIQMFSALVMNLIQSVVALKAENVMDAGNELHLLATYSMAQNIAFKFLTMFFRTCGMKHGEDDFRMIFENFLADLLLTANRAEWPASEILLSLLSKILMKNFSNNSVPLPVRIQSLDYLGSVAAQLRKDTIDMHVLNSRENRERLENVLDKTLACLDIDEETQVIYRTDIFRYHRSLLIYLNELSEYETTNRFAKLFHLGQWIRDMNVTIERLTQTLTRRPCPSKQDESCNGEASGKSQTNNNLTSVSDEIERKKSEKSALFKLLNLPPVRPHPGRYLCDVDYDDVCLLIRYLTSSRPFLKTFDVYLKQLAAIFQSEAGSNLRSKAMKCLCTVVEADPSILTRNDIKSCVQVGLTDKSISVREAAIDLIGRYIVQKQQLILQYYDVLCERSIDTGVSVRKRVVKIFRDVCLTQADFVRIPDICARLLRRLNDEESIRKLVFDTFQQIWFTPTRDRYELRNRVQTIIDVLIDGQKQNNTWLETLIKEFLHIDEKLSNEEKRKLQEQRQIVLKAIQDLINELVESILKIESANDQVSSNKMVATFTAVYALGKAEPRHVLPHFSTIVEYLNIKCTSYNDNVIVQYVAKILEFTVPLMKSVSSSVIYSLEGSLTKLLLVSGQLVIQSSIACLSAAVRLSKNTSLVKDVFQRYHNFVRQSQEQPNHSAQLARAIYILGVLCKYFDLEKAEYNELQFSADDLFQLFLFYLQRNDSMVKLKSLVALGFFLQRYGRYLVEDPIRQYYHQYLLDRQPSAGQLRCQVLINLEEYFRDCIRRMADYDIDYLENKDELKSDEHIVHTGADLKDTTDVHSEMASSIAQCYLRIVLETYLSEDEIIRQCVRKVVTCILEQGLVHPVQFIPYLIAMTTDQDLNIQQSAEQNLQQLDKTHPGIIQTKVLHGLKMSYQLQELMIKSRNSKSKEIIRGMTKLTVSSYSHQQLPFCSVNHFLYSLIRSSRVYRRALICHLLKMFENDVGNNQLTLEEQLFVADNLAYFPYQVQDEPLYLVEQIDLVVSVNGSSQLQSFRELLKHDFRYVDDDEGVDMKKLEEKFSQAAKEKIDEFQRVLSSSKSILLLLLLKSYLKDVYCLNETKIIEYDHSESSKLLDRPIVTRKLSVNFEPKSILQTIRPTVFSDPIENYRQMIREFAEFKRHLLSFDGDVDDTIHLFNELVPNSTGKGKKRGSNTSKRRKVMIDSDDDESFDVDF